MEQSAVVQAAARRAAWAGVTVVGIATAASLGCDDTALGRARPDAGLTGPPPLEPLKFRPGAIFRYSGRLTASTGVEERSASFELALTIAAVRDGRGQAPSELSITGEGRRTSSTRWDATAGYDGWLARLGPADDGDLVAAGAVDVALDAAPTLPPHPKRLPPATGFFLDLRDLDALREAFVAANAGRGPRSLAPDQHPLGRLVLALDADDPGLEYYEPASRRRRLELEYDPDGWLVFARETLGDADQHPTLPHASSTLELTSP